MNKIANEKILSAHLSKNTLRTLIWKASDFFMTQLRPSLEASAAVIEPTPVEESRPAQLNMAVMDSWKCDDSYSCLCYEAYPLEGILWELNCTRSPYLLSVTNLDAGVSHADVTELFSAFGKLRAVAMLSGPSGESLGQAVVVFDKGVDGYKAMSRYNGRTLDGRPMQVQEIHNSFPVCYGKEPDVLQSPGKLLLSNLDSDVTASHIIELFSWFPYIVAAAVNYDESGRSLGSGYVVFEKFSSAAKAMKKFMGASIDGQPILIQLTTCEPDLDAKSSGRLILSNLDQSVVYSDINELFSKIGELRHATVHYDEWMSKRPLGTAEVVFKQRSDAIKAMEQLSGHLLKGRPIQIQLPSSQI